MVNLLKKGYHMNIYTRNGDFGYTSDLNGQKISKASIKLDLQGTIDEVNAAIGYLRALIQKSDQGDLLSNNNLALHDIQFKLFQIGSDISADFQASRLTAQDVTGLEEGIDHMLATTGELHHFLCLSGTEATSWCHTVRSITRRAERLFVHYLQSLDIEPPEDYKYLNRLSDYLFQTARYINWVSDLEEETC